MLQFIDFYVHLNDNNIYSEYENTGAREPGAPNKGGLRCLQPPPLPLNFGEGDSTPPDFGRIFCLISHIGPFLIAQRRNSKK